MASLCLVTVGSSTVSARSNGKSLKGGKKGSESSLLEDDSSEESAREFTVPGKLHRKQADSSSRKFLRLKGARLQTHLEDGHMIVTGMSGSMAGGRVQMTGRIDTSQADGPQHARLALDNVLLSEVFDLLEMENNNAVQARVSGVLDLNWEGLASEQIRESLRGTIQLNTGPGTLPDSPLLAKLRDISGVSELESLAFEKGKIRASIDQGQVRFQTVDLDGQDLNLEAKGYLGLLDGDMDVAFGIDVAPELAKKSKYYKMSSVISIFNKNAVPKTTAAGLVEVPRFSVVGKLPKPEVVWQKDLKEVASSAEPSEVREVASGNGEQAPEARVAMDDAGGAAGQADVKPVVRSAQVGADAAVSPEKTRRLAAVWNNAINRLVKEAQVSGPKQ